MSWVKVDDQLFLRPRARAVGLEGRALFVAGLCYCSVNLTDGVITEPCLPFVADMAEVPPNVAERLVNVGLWASHVEGVEVVDYLKFNPSREQVLAEREAAKQRRQRASGERRPNVAGSSDASSTSPDFSNRSSSSLTLVGDDDDFLPKGFWQLYAQRKLEQQPAGKVQSPAPWLARTAENGAREQGERAKDLFARFDVSPRELADALVSGVVPQSWGCKQRSAS